jgi:hypothetical protein
MAKIKRALLAALSVRKLDRHYIWVHYHDI